MEPAVRAYRLPCPLGIAVIPLEDSRSPHQNFPVRRDPAFQPFKRQTHRAKLVVFRPIDMRHRRGLGKAVALEDKDAQSMKELRNLLGQRGAAGNRQAQPAAQAGVNLGKDQPPGREISDAQRPGSVPPLAPTPADTLTHPERAAKNGSLKSGASRRSGADAAVGVFVNSRNGEEKRRTNHQEILGNCFHRAGKGAGDPLGDHHKMLQAAEGMGKGQELKINVLICKEDS